MAGDNPAEQSPSLKSNKQLGGHHIGAEKFRFINLIGNGVHIRWFLPGFL